MMHEIPLQGSQRHSFPEFSHVVYQPNRSQECRLCMPARFLDCEAAEQAKPKVSVMVGGLVLRKHPSDGSPEMGPKGRSF